MKTDMELIEEERTGLSTKIIKSPEEIEYVMNLAREYVNIPEVRKSILMQVKGEITRG